MSRLQPPCTSISHLQFTALDVPFFILLGALIGCFAVLFNRGVLAGIAWNRRIFDLGLRWRIAIAGCVSGVAIALVPFDFRDSSGLQQFLASGETAWQETAGAFAVRFVLTLIACSAETPGGIFAPTLILGAALGSLFGNWHYDLTNSGSPAIYALAGMGAFFGAVAKVPITAFVIVFEMTMDFNIVLPLMIVTVIAFVVAEKFIPGSLYTQLLAMNGISLVANTPPDGIWLRLKAADIMQKKVETFPIDMTLDRVRLAFTRSHHRGFPVLDRGQLVGIITETDLVKINDRQLLGTQIIKEIMTPNPIVVNPEDSLSQVLYLLSYYKLSRLPVIDSSRLVGIITRSDILRVEVEKLKGADHKSLDRSYAIYQTRGLCIGKGRLLLLLKDNLEENTHLASIALAIAQSLGYELECLSILTIPSHLSTAKTPVQTNHTLYLLSKVVAMATSMQVPIHTQIRVSHDSNATIQEVIEERFIDLLLLDWQQGYVRVSCDLLVSKKSVERYFPILGDRWLIIVAEANYQDSLLSFVPHFVSLADNPQIHLCQVTKPSDNYDSTDLERNTKALSRELKLSIEITSICSKSISDAVVDIVEQERCDLIILIANPNQIGDLSAIACNIIFVGRA